MGLQAINNNNNNKTMGAQRFSEHMLTCPRNKV